MRRLWSFWTFLAVCAAEEQRQLATRLAPNLALGQKVDLSSTAQFVSDDGTETWTGDGFRATDGDFGTAFFFGLGCAETQVEPNPWLRVDLGREVPVAVVRILTRSDSVDTGLGPLDIRLGNEILTWRENLVCAEAVMLDRLQQPNIFNCLASGRYLWLVLRVSGTMVAPLSVCEVEVTPKGPSGNRHILQTAGGMWPLQLQGVALDPHDRIRIVADTVLCGLEGSATMHDAVLALTAPMGQRAHGDFRSETWENIQVNRMGIYKVCWCGGDGDCSADEHFSMHVATLIINGIMLTVVGDGRVPNRTIDMVDGAPGFQSPLGDPFASAMANSEMDKWQAFWPSVPANWNSMEQLNLQGERQVNQTTVEQEVFDNASQLTAQKYSEEEGLGTWLARFRYEFPWPVKFVQVQPKGKERRAAGEEDVRPRRESVPPACPAELDGGGVPHDYTQEQWEAADCTIVQDDTLARCTTIVHGVELSPPFQPIAEAPLDAHDKWRWIKRKVKGHEPFWEGLRSFEASAMGHALPSRRVARTLPHLSIGASAFITEGAQIKLAEVWRRAVGRVQPTCHGVVPQAWSEAIVDEIHKKGTMGDPQDYRNQQCSQEQTSTDWKLSSHSIAVSNQRVFFTERGTHMLRWLDIEEGRVYTLAGQFFPGVRGDFGSAFNAQLSTPLGLALDRDHTSLYIADYGSDRVRKIDLTQDPLNRGIIETVAGNGFRGFSGDGGPAREAQLNGPSGVAVDLNQMLWICDSGNNVLRVVSMEIPVRIPGSNEFQANVILTAAGGSTGQSQGKGDGGVAWLARMQGPSGVAVSSAFVSNEDGTLPVNVYIAESMGQQVRSMSLEFQSYLGVINTLAGSGQRGNDLQEGLPLEAPNAELNEPSGVATDAGLVYLSDSANNRLLMMPALEYVSMGCWRENIESPWIPSIEGEPLPWGIDYLQGIPENRPAAITACALATLRLGYEVFAIRQMGVCATSKDAHLYFRFEGSSTSCDQGKGGARDNSVYRFARQGMMTQQQGLVYVLAGREGDAGFAGDQGSAWVTQLNRPNGLGVNPMTKDIYVADSGNNRIRLIFSQIGPGVHHSGYCTNGLACEVTIMGNGLLPGNKLAVIPMEQSCGQPGVMFQMGLAMNPTSEIPSPSFTQKTFNFGPPSVPRTGTYRLCFCVKDAVVFGQITPCNAAEFFIHDAGIVRIVGPDSRIDDAEVVEGMPGRPLALAIFGHELSLFDRVRLVNDSQPCGVPGAEVLAEEVQSRDILMGRRYQGNESFSLWVNVTLRASGSFRVCWCQGARIDGTRLRCERGEDFRVEAARVNIRGPIQYVGTIKTGSYEEIAVKGGQLAGFSSSDRIRLVDAATVQCGSMEAQAFSISIENEQVDAVPSGAPHRITADSVTWTNVKVRTSQPLRVCWCGDTEACDPVRAAGA
ncbi:hypothetical protein AK812_SmicGene31314 [Symbiodinium microadriaticum]|uniref:Fucolectin tachylectin-4 pentraxin-1 domain-containing protein n=1 Tax=Symbiodinium microadriaticum TaxID=2951 RepID=A0A1Q9CX53_SYMMI|nr:hypothetical protein AK812_SmicGene31314 [Symbiodinium microadriaticum]